MAKRSDFAQKLLDDLRLRKERMAASENSKGSNPMVAEAYAYSKTAYKSSREPKTLKATDFRAGSTQNRPSGGRKSVTTAQVSNQIVPFGRGHKSEKIGDLSMALAIALENGGKLGRPDSSGTSSMFSFLRIRRHPSRSQLPTNSHLHIEEISRGAQKLNQMLRACYNGLNFDRYSIEIGRELLKGAMDLEESLRMLVNLQEASEYLITPRRKSQITLLEEDEDDDDENPVKMSDQKQLDMPRFSFDRHSRNYNDIQDVAKADLKQRPADLTYSSRVTNSKHGKKVLAASNSYSHKGSVSYVPDIKTLTAVSEQNHSISLQSKHEKLRIPNVIVKLMGLDELPGVDSKVTAEESGRQKVEAMIIKRPAQESSKKAEQRTKDSETLVLPPVKLKATLASKISMIQDTVTSQPGKVLTTRNGSTRVDVHDKLLSRKDLEDLKPVTRSRKAYIKIDKQQSDIVQLDNNSGSRKEIQDKERNHSSLKHMEWKITERSEIKEPVFEDEIPQTIPYVHKRSEAAVTMQEKADYSESKLHGENRYAKKLLLGNQQKLQSNHGFQQVCVLQKSKLQEKKRQPEERKQQSSKQKLQGKKQKPNEPKCSDFSKPTSGATATSLQEKQPQINQAATSRKGSNEHIDATQFNGFRDGKHHANQARDRSSSFSTNSNVKIQYSLNRNSRHSLGDQESAKARILFAVDEKPIEVQRTMKARSAKGHKLEVPPINNKVMTKKGASVVKHQGSILHEKLAISREADQMKASRLEEVEAQIIGSNKSAASVKTLSLAQEMQKAAQRNSISCSLLEDECESLNRAQALVQKDSGQNTVPMVTNQQQDQEPEFGRAEESKFKNRVSDPLHGTHEESTEISHTPQPQNQRSYMSEMVKPLTESENHLKNILMKSQPFMNTAKALFELDIPISILHGNGHDYDHEQESKLVLDCGYEVMKRKGKRMELSVLPFLKLSVITSNKAKSMDDLVKQMCEDFDKLRLYGRDGKEDSPFEDNLLKMLEADVNNKEPNVNCMWDLGWNCMIFAFLEKDDVIRDLEKYVLNGLLDDITRDTFILTSASA